MNQENNNDKLIANNLAMLLVTYKTDEQSLDKAISVIEVLRGEENPLFLDTMGWVYYKNDQHDLALPLIKQAAENAPDVAQIQYHLALTYHGKNDLAQTIKYLEKALDFNQNFTGKAEAEELLAKLKAQS